MESNLKEYSKIVETKSKKKSLNRNKRYNSYSPCCNHRCSNYISNSKYKCSNGRKWINKASRKS